MTKRQVVAIMATILLQKRSENYGDQDVSMMINAALFIYEQTEAAVLRRKKSQ